MDHTLRDLVEALRDREMTPQEHQEQRVSFAFGNAPSEDQTTKEEVRSIVEGTTKPKAIA